MKGILEKRGILTALGALVLLCAVSYLLVFSPKIREIRRLQAEVAAKETEMGDAIRLWGEMAQTPGSESHRWEERVLAFREKVPEAPETDRLMAEIGRRAVLHNLRGFRLSIPAEGKVERTGVAEGPGAAGPEAAELAKATGFEELRFRLSFLSTYRDMAEFVDGVPRMKRLLGLRSVSVREKEGEMETTLELSAFYGKPR